MEIPIELKELYSHWEKHSLFIPTKKITKSKFQKELFQIEKFINERMLVWEKKYQDQKPPFTNDPILRDFRFCNIYRELDRQTIEIHKSLKHLKSDFNLWLLNLCFNRFLCNPITFLKAGELNFDLKNNSIVKEKLLNLPRPKYGSAYVFPISIIQRSEFNTRETFFYAIFTINNTRNIKNYKFI